MKAQGICFCYIWIALWIICGLILILIHTWAIISFKGPLTQAIVPSSMKRVDCTSFTDNGCTGTCKQHGMEYIYDRKNLFQIWDEIHGKAGYKVLEPQTVINIRKYRIFRRLSRGGRWNRELLREQRSVVRRVSLNNLHVIKCAKSDHTYAAHQMNMTMSTVNVQSITRRKKDMVISDILHEFKLDMFVLTETWLTNQDNDRDLG